MEAPTDLAALAQDIADEVCGCLSSSPLATPDECTVYWSTPPDDLDCGGDCSTNGSLIVWLDRMWLTNQFPAEYGANLGKEHPVTAAKLNVRLIRPCWPAVGDTPMPTPLPSRDTTADYSADLMTDASIVFCCLLAEAELGRAGIFVSCRRVALGALSPDRNRGGCAGFTVPVTVDLGRCCVPGS